MPKAMHDALQREAASKGLKGDEADRFVYGTLYNYEHKKGSFSNSKSQPKSKSKSSKKKAGSPHPGHHVTGSGHARY